MWVADQIKTSFFSILAKNSWKIEFELFLWCTISHENYSLSQIFYLWFWSRNMSHRASWNPESVNYFGETLCFLVCLRHWMWMLGQFSKFLVWAHETLKYNNIAISVHVVQKFETFCFSIGDSLRLPCGNSRPSKWPNPGSKMTR